VFGSALDRIDSDRIDYDRIDFERINLCLNTIMQNWLNKLNVVWIVFYQNCFWMY